MEKQDKSLIYPLFIPMRGCRSACVYCNQHKITGAGAFNLQEARVEVAAFIERNSPKPKQVAFYGGTFTALPVNEQIEYLSAMQEVLEDGDGLRISTHPAFIDEITLNRLRNHRVATIELGIQDFCDEVLNATGRNYTSVQAIQAANAVRKAGFEMGVQLMPGLPGSNIKSHRYNLQVLSELRPDLLRLYPTIVIRGTKLEKMYLEDRYQPLSLKSAIDICADFTKLCKANNIRIIKYGLPSNLNISEVVAGPYHPAFGELVKQALLRREIEHNPSRKQHLTTCELQLLRAHRALELSL